MARRPDTCVCPACPGHEKRRPESGSLALPRARVPRLPLVTDAVCFGVLIINYRLLSVCSVPGRVTGAVHASPTEQRFKADNRCLHFHDGTQTAETACPRSLCQHTVELAPPFYDPPVHLYDNGGIRHFHVTLMKSTGMKIYLQILVLPLKYSSFPSLNRV